MFTIDSMSRQPVYEQLVEQAEWLILSRLLSEGDQLPSVRSLSIELSVNPNTIQKAYSELDSRGIIYSVPGIGCFVAQDALDRVSAYKKAKLGDLRTLLTELSLAGTTRQEILNMIEEIFISGGKI